MSRPHELGVCILCLDLTVHGGASAGPETLPRRLLEAGIPVTWGVGASQAALGQILLAVDAASEIALMADGSWSAADASRRHFADRLNHGLAQFRSIGLNPKTLVVSHGRRADHDDLLVKHGIQVVRLDARSASGQPSAGWWRRARAEAMADPIRAVRWGVWEAAPTASLKHDGGRSVERVIDRLSREGGIATIVANAELLESNERLAARWIRQLRRRREESAIRFATLAGIAAGLQVSRPSLTARSILHAA